MQSGETTIKKELVPVGGRPILWHVMQSFSTYGFHRFILCLGHMGEQIKRYFLNYDTLSRDFTLHLGEEGSQAIEFHNQRPHPAWEVTLVDTGLNTEKASRIAQVAPHIQAERFFVSYGDDVSDVDLAALVAFHEAHGKMATLTAVQVNLEYGVVEADETGLVQGFVERPRLAHWINGGYMLFERPVLAQMQAGTNVNLETQVLPHLAAEGQLMMYRHKGFWKSMNTMKDNITLEQIWQAGAPWKKWA
ncbi:MAG: glucose-1-phosphate cytidylyltransferase [Chloroflexi bacterium]|nr:glucose-1-phosphate cytidylyltransferase [Chloroflexota bacterium]